jgi:hypothetical protein
MIERAESRSRRLIREDRYVVVLLLILGSIVSSALLSEGARGLIVPLAFTSATLLVTLSTSGASPKVELAGRLVVLFAFATVVVAYYANYEAAATVGFFIAMLALSLATPVVIARRLWKHPKISTNTVAGAADIYLLIGLLFALVYAFIGAVQAGGLGGTSVQGLTPHAAFFIAARPTQPSDFIYFSFTTLSTVGYGDLTSTSEVGRLLSNTEALLGQLYLVTVVAVLVSNIGRVRQQPEAPLESETEPE